MAIHRIYIDGTWYLLPIPEKADTLEATGATNDNKFMTPKKTKELIDSLDLGAISEVVTTGTGNAVTNITVSSDGKTLTATKGSTFSLTNHTHSLNSSAITGVLPISKGGTGATSASTARDALGLGSLALKNSLTPDDIPNLDAGKITTGTFATARIPNLSTSKITSGEFNRARIREMLCKDTRDVSENPSELNTALRVDFKRTTIINLTDEGTYSGVLTIRPYGSTTDFSGGPVHQIALTQNGGLLHRVSTGQSSWGDWKKIVYSGHSHNVSDIVGLGALAVKDSLSPSDIPNLDAGKITTGTFSTARIPNLDAGKITSGTFSTARIPNLDAGKITSGTFNAARIPNLDAGKITSGTLSTDRIPDLNVSKIIGLGNIATQDLSSDFTWTGKQTFRGQVEINQPNSSSVLTFISTQSGVGSKVYNLTAPAGSSATYNIILPSKSGTLATTDDLTWDNITDKPSLVDTTSNQSIDGVKTFAKKITINYQTAEQIELMASSGKVVLRTSSGQLMMMNNGDSSWGAVLSNNNLGYYTKTVFGKSLVGTGNIEIEADDVPTLPYTKISGLGSLALKSSLSPSDIPNLDAGKITTGTFATARIPNLDASKITTGTFSTARIPNLSVSKITDLGNIATKDLSSDFTWTGSHNFKNSISFTPNTATYYLAAPETGSGTVNLPFNKTGTVALTSDLTWDNITSKPTAFNPSSHSHGNITNDGKIGTEANRVIVTGTDGVLIAKPAGGPNQFLSSNGSWATPIASANTSIDYNWTGEHVFQKQITLTGDLAGAEPKYPSIKASILTPEGSYTREWEMPSSSGTLATLDNVPGVVYGYCSTSASTTAKVVSSNTFTSHKTGQIYVIEFVNGNTATAPTININSTGAIGVRHLTTNGAVTTSPGTDIMYARSRTIWTFVYNGTYLIPIGKSTRYWNALETKMLGYSKGSSSSAITTSDTVSSAIGKLEYRLDNSSGGGGMTYSFSSSHVTYDSGYDSKIFVIDSDTAFIEIHFHSSGQTHTQYMLSRAALFSDSLGIVMPDHMIYPASSTNMGVECMFANGGYIGVIQHKFS